MATEWMKVRLIPKDSMNTKSRGKESGWRYRVDEINYGLMEMYGLVYLRLDLGDRRPFFEVPDGGGASPS
jgi:hypothetical protein